MNRNSSGVRRMKKPMKSVGMFSIATMERDKWSAHCGETACDASLSSWDCRSLDHATARKGRRRRPFLRRALNRRNFLRLPRRLDLPAWAASLIPSICRRR
jgi:hypothetical protein